LTPRSKRVLELAMDEAKRLKHDFVGTEHLLLGLIEEGEGIAAGILQGMGLSSERVRTQVIEMLKTLDERTLAEDTPENAEPTQSDETTTGLTEQEWQILI